jgi:hypothetical protein
MRAFTCAAITLVTVTVSAPFAGTAFAQAGSTGGTLGNTDKSISGERREEPAVPKSHSHKVASAPAEAKSKSSGCGNVVGTYQWIIGIGVLKSGGVATISVAGVQGTGRAPTAKLRSFGTMATPIISRQHQAADFLP